MKSAHDLNNLKKRSSGGLHSGCGLLQRAKRVPETEAIVSKISQPGASGRGLKRRYRLRKWRHPAEKIRLARERRRRWDCATCAKLATVEQGKTNRNRSAWRRLTRRERRHGVGVAPETAAMIATQTVAPAVAHIRGESQSVENVSAEVDLMFLVKAVAWEKHKNAFLAFNQVGANRLANALQDNFPAQYPEPDGRPAGGTSSPKGEEAGPCKPEIKIARSNTANGWSVTRRRVRIKYKLRAVLTMVHWEVARRWRLSGEG